MESGGDVSDKVYRALNLSHHRSDELVAGPWSS